MIHTVTIARLAAVASLTLLVAACGYDHMQHTDRVGYSAGDAVKANLESQTMNPSKDSMSNVGGLGKNGPVAVAPTTTSGS